MVHDNDADEEHVTGGRLISRRTRANLCRIDWRESANRYDDGKQGETENETNNHPSRTKRQEDQCLHGSPCLCLCINACMCWHTCCGMRAPSRTCMQAINAEMEGTRFCVTACRGVLPVYRVYILSLPLIFACLCVCVLVPVFVYVASIDVSTCMQGAMIPRWI